MTIPDDNELAITCPDVVLPVTENCEIPFSMIPDPIVTTDECEPVIFDKTVDSTSLGPGTYTVTVSATDAASNEATCEFTLEIIDDAPIDPEACTCSDDDGGANVLEGDDKGDIYSFTCDPKPNGCPQTVDSLLLSECITCEPVVVLPTGNGSSKGKSGKSTGKKGKGCGTNCGIDLDIGEDNEFGLDKFGPAGTFISVLARVIDDVGNVGLAQCTLCVSEAADTGKSRRERHQRELRRGNGGNGNGGKGSLDELETFECPTAVDPIPFECPAGFQEVEEATPTGGRNGRRGGRRAT